MTLGYLSACPRYYSNGYVVPERRASCSSRCQRTARPVHLSLDGRRSSRYSSPAACCAGVVWSLSCPSINQHWCIRSSISVPHMLHDQFGHLELLASRWPHSAGRERCTSTPHLRHAPLQRLQRHKARLTSSRVPFPEWGLFACARSSSPPAPSGSPRRAARYRS
jgi:hypothetical protein